jgi:hypothetical protein
MAEAKRLACEPAEVERRLSGAVKAAVPQARYPEGSGAGVVRQLRLFLAHPYDAVALARCLTMPGSRRDFLFR